MSTLPDNIWCRNLQMCKWQAYLPEPLYGDDTKSWFKRFEVCAAANEWDDTKKLLHTPTLLKGRAWAVYESLSEAETDTHAHLKMALLARLSLDTAEERLIACEELSRKKLVEGRESIDELARCIERLVDKASLGLPANVCSSELQYHLINALSEKVSLQLKLMPQESHQQTVSKARELLLIYGRSTVTEQTNQLLASPSSTRLDKLEEALQQVTEQLATLNQHSNAGNQRRCFACGRPGHFVRDCRYILDVKCFRCGAKGHLARNCGQQGNGRGSGPKR